MNVRRCVGVVSLTVAVGVMVLLLFEFIQRRRRGVESA